MRGKPEKERRILEVEWHYHRYCYCYIVETQTWKERGRCPAYWFEEQLQPATWPVRDASLHATG